MTGRTVVLGLAVLLLLGTWPLLALAVRRSHGLPRRLDGTRRAGTTRSQRRADRQFARRHGVR